MANKVGITLRLTGLLLGDELVKELNSHKLMVIPSLWEEPFGNVALEGMACGCLVLASDGGGLPDAVGKAGLTFERGSVEDLERKLSLIFNNPDIALELESHTKSHLRNHVEYTVCDKYLKILEKNIPTKPFI